MHLYLFLSILVSMPSEPTCSFLSWPFSSIIISCLQQTTSTLRKIHKHQLFYSNTPLILFLFHWPHFIWIYVLIVTLLLTYFPTLQLANQNLEFWMEQKSTLDSTALLFLLQDSKWVSFLQLFYTLFSHSDTEDTLQQYWSSEGAL